MEEPKKRGVPLWLGAIVAAVVLIGGGIAFGLLVVYPNSVKDKLKTEYTAMDAAVGAIDVDGLSQHLGGQAAQDVAKLAPLATLLKTVPNTVKLSSRTTIMGAKVRGGRAVVEVERTFEATGSLRIVGRVYNLGDKQAIGKETHTWERTAGQWKLTDFGDHGPLRDALAQLPF
jgi:hypothetical protein